MLSRTKSLSAVVVVVIGPLPYSQHALCWTSDQSLQVCWSDDYGSFEYTEPIDNTVCQGSETVLLFLMTLDDRQGMEILFMGKKNIIAYIYCLDIFTILQIMATAIYGRQINLLITNEWLSEQINFMLWNVLESKCILVMCKGLVAISVQFYSLYETAWQSVWHE